MRLSTLLPVAVVAALLIVPSVEAHKSKSASTQHHSKTKKPHTSSTGEPSSSSTPKPSSTKSSGSGGGHVTTGKPLPSPGPALGEDMLDPTGLFPVTSFKTAFSTAPASPSLPNDSAVKRVTLDDTTLQVTKAESGVNHTVVAATNAPAGTQAWEAFYPKGSYNPSGTPRGGFGFYVGGPTDFDFTSANELVFSYAVMFEDGFMFNKGGKLPGPYGGTSAEEAYACSGGRQLDRDQCFDLRLMFRTNGMGEIYAYLPEVDQNTQAFMNVPGSVEDSAYGFSVGRGSFSFVPGKWTVVAERVKLNDASQANGEIELFVDGQSMINATNLIIRQHPEAVFRGAHFQTFFGGATSDWGSPQDQKAYFADITAAILS